MGHGTNQRKFSGNSTRHRSIGLDLTFCKSPVISILIAADRSGVDSVKQRIKGICHGKGTLSDYAAAALLSALIEYKEWDLCEELLTNLDFTPTSSVTILRYASVVANGLGDQSLGLERSRLAIQRDQEDIFSQLHYTRELWGQSNLEDAILHLKKYVGDHPEAGIAHRFLGELLIHTGKFAEGINSLERAVTISPANAESRSKLGSSLLACELKGGKNPSKEALDVVIQNLHQACVLSNFGNLEYIRNYCYALVCKREYPMALSIIDERLEDHALSEDERLFLIDAKQAMKDMDQVLAAEESSK